MALSARARTGSPLVTTAEAPRRPEALSTVRRLIVVMELPPVGRMMRASLAPSEGATRGESSSGIQPCYANSRDGVIVGVCSAVVKRGRIRLKRPDAREVLRTIGRATA